MSANQGPEGPRQEPPWSEDRQWWWNGQEWRPAAEYRPTKPSGIPPGVGARPVKYSWLWIGGAGLAALLVLSLCVAAISSAGSKPAAPATTAAATAVAQVPVSTLRPSPTATPTPTPSPTAAPTPPPAATAAPVQDPMAALRAQGISAICNDGSYSYSQHRSGTCSHHGGVREWTGLI
jgi:hypothetical protein